jgi:hypothetical protein
MALRVVVLDAEVAVAEQALRDDQVVRLVAAEPLNTADPEAGCSNDQKADQQQPCRVPIDVRDRRAHGVSRQRCHSRQHGAAHQHPAERPGQYAERGKQVRRARQEGHDQYGQPGQRRRRPRQVMQRPPSEPPDDPHRDQPRDGDGEGAEHPRGLGQDRHAFRAPARPRDDEHVRRRESQRGPEAACDRGQPHDQAPRSRSLAGEPGVRGLEPNPVGGATGCHVAF